MQKIFSGSTDATDLRTTRQVTLYTQSGSLGNKIDSAYITFQLSTNAYGPSYTISVDINGIASASTVCQLNSSNYTGATFTVYLSNINNVDWSSSYLTMNINCTSTSGSKANIFVKGTQKVVVESTQEDTGGGDSGGSGGDGGSGSGSTVTASSIALTANTATVGSVVSVNITPVDSSNYHIVRWLIGSTVVSGPTTLSAGTLSSSITISSSHMTYIPNSSSGTLVCNVQTYSSSGDSAGYAAAQCTLNVPSSYVPNFNIALNPTNLRNDSYYQNITRPGVNITSISAGYGASLSTYTVTCTGMSNITNNNTNNSVSYTYSTPITVTGSCTLSVKIADSRGRSTTKSLTFTVLGYSSPTVSNYDTYRCNTSGSSTTQGDCLRVTITNYRVGNMSDSSMKISTIAVEYKLTESSSYTTAQTYTINAQSGNLDRTITSPRFPNTNNYDIRIAITDTFGATVYLYDKIFKYSSVLFDICGVSGNCAVGIGEAVTGVSGMNNVLQINGNWVVKIGSDDIKNLFLKVTDIEGNNGKVRRIYYGSSAPSNPTTGSIWIKQV